MTEPKTVAVLLAAGSGERLGADRPKAFVDLGGRPMVAWSVDTLKAVAGVQKIVVTLPEGGWTLKGVTGVRGGRTRSHSVKAALEAVSSYKRILVHDAARPFASVDLFERVLAELDSRGCDCTVAAAPVLDTIKRSDCEGVVQQTLDRKSLWAVQTPQAFRYEALIDALAVSDDRLAAATDDASLVEFSGGSVRIVRSSADNFKITTQRDLRYAQLMLDLKRSHT